MADSEAGPLGTYNVRYGCPNCGASFSKAYLKGMEAAKKVICSNCGCYTAEKGWQRPIVLPVRPRDDRDYPYIPYPPAPRPRIPGVPWKKAYPPRPYYVRDCCSIAGGCFRCRPTIGGGEPQRNFIC